MEKWFIPPPNALWTIVLSAIGIYLVLILFTRLAGKRSFSKISSFDFAVTVGIGSLLATTILSARVSLVEGITALAIVYLCQVAAGLLRSSPFIKKMMDNTPLLLMDGPTILHDNLRKARLQEADLRCKLREANVHDLKQIRAVVFETTGDISVLHTTDMNAELEEWLLKDVEK